jgi:signal transduction histidine kinase/DNA-binding response OmpR family regulator
MSLKSLICLLKNRLFADMCRLGITRAKVDTSYDVDVAIYLEPKKMSSSPISAKNPESQKKTFFRFHLINFLAIFLSLSLVLALIISFVYLQESQATLLPAAVAPYIKIFILLVVFTAVCSWWVIQNSEIHRLEQEESQRQTDLLLTEITARLRIDKELQSARDRAEASSQAKTRYITGITHELRTPLTSILGYAHLLLKNRSLNHYERETITTLERSGQHMRSLIDESMDLARIEAGKFKLEVIPIQLFELIKDVENMIRPQAQAKGLLFKITSQGRKPDWVLADPKRMRQILINLLSNAVRFTQVGDIALHLDFRNNVTRIEVTDTGVGIALRDQERIFMPFERGSAGRRTSDLGTGLGLTITHLLTNMMGGDIQLRSEPGMGSTFTLRMYLPEIVQRHSPPSPAVEKLGVIKGYVGRRKTLLVVDDQPLHRQLLCSVLIPLDFTVLEAASGSEAFEILAQIHVDIVLLDLTMDGMDGWQTASALRVIYPAEQLPIIFVSANLIENASEMLTQFQCQDFVTKPVNESDLLRALAIALSLQWTRIESFSSKLVHEPSTQITLSLSSLAIPAQMREDMVRLAKQGQSAALRQLLSQTGNSQLAYSGSFAHMRALVEQFEFDALVQYLKQIPLTNNKFDAR